MKAFRCAFTVSILVTFCAASAGAASDVAVSHFEKIQNFVIARPSRVGLQTPSADDPVTLQFNAMGRSFDLQLESNDRLLSATARAKLDARIELFRGRLAGQADSWVRIVLADGAPRGMIWDGEELFAVEAPGDSSLATDQPIIYRLADAIISPGTMSCGASLPTGNGSEVFTHLMSDLGASMLQGPGATTQMNVGAIGDSAFVNSKGAGADTAITTRLNNVDGIFSQQLGIQLAVQTLELFDSQTDPFSATTDASDLLNELGMYRDGNAAQNANGITHMYTGRNLDGSTVGIAYGAAICLSRFAAGLSEGNRDVTTDSLIAAHEIGHNFGAPHDGEAGSACEAETGMFLMSPSITGIDQFSTCSITEMQPVIAAANCFVPLPGTDIAIAPGSAPLVTLLGNSATANYTVANNGTTAAENVMVDIAVPSLTDIVSASATVGSCTDGAGTANCQLGTVAGGSSVTITVSTITSAVGTDAFSATVTATVDDNAGNNQAGLSLTVDPAVDVAITTPSQTQVLVDQSASVNINIDNNAVLDANNITLNVTADAGIQFDSASWTIGNCTLTNQQIDCQATSLASQSGSMLSIGVTATSSGIQNYTVSVNTDEDDRDTTNNNVSGSFSVNLPQAEDSGGGGAVAWGTLVFLIMAIARRRPRRLRSLL